MNVVVLRGTIARPTETRSLATGVAVLQFDLTTPVGDASTTVPVAWVAPPDTASFDPGDELVVVGSVRRRFFRVGGGTQSRTEVVADGVAKASSRRSVDKLLAIARRGFEAG